MLIELLKSNFQFYCPICGELYYFIFPYDTIHKKIIECECKSKMEIVTYGYKEKIELTSVLILYA